MSVSFPISINTGWMATEQSADFMVSECSSCYTLSRTIIIRKDESKLLDDTKNAILDINVISLCKGLPFTSIEKLNICCNARFVEIYARSAQEDFVYIETIRGGLIELGGCEGLQMFSSDCKQLLKCLEMRLKFVSVKSTPTIVTVKNVAFSIVENISKNAVPQDINNNSAAIEASGINSGHSVNNCDIDPFGIAGVGQFGVIIEAVKMSLIQDIARLLDTKLAPVVKKIEVLDVRLDQLNKEMGQLRYNTAAYRVTDNTEQIRENGTGKKALISSDSEVVNEDIVRCLNVSDNIS